MILHGQLDFRSLVDRMKIDVNRAARQVRDPEGDIAPRLYLYRSQHQALHVLDVPGDHFGSRQAKDLLAQTVIPVLVELGDVRLVGLQMTGYESRVDFATLTPEEQRVVVDEYRIPDRMPPPSQDPRRIEQIIVHVFDAEVREWWTRRIIRAPGRRPVYGPWAVAPEMGFGRMVDPIAAALR